MPSPVVAGRRWGSELVLVDAVRAVAATALLLRSPPDFGEALRADSVAALEVHLADEPTAPITAVDDLALLADLTEAGDTHATG